MSGAGGQPAAWRFDQSAAMWHHVELLVGGGEMDGRPSAVVLGDEVGISFHNLRQLLRIAEPDGAVERDGRVLRDGRIPAAIPRDLLSTVLQDDELALPALACPWPSCRAS